MIIRDSRLMLLVLENEGLQLPNISTLLFTNSFYGPKDTVLGSANMLFSWDRLYKQLTSHLPPPTASQSNLIRLLWVVDGDDNAGKQSMMQIVGVQVQAKRISHERIERAKDPRQDWIRRAGCEIPTAITQSA
jgi:hypothetical protein